jgi:hypothetical protein
MQKWRCKLSIAGMQVVGLGVEGEYEGRDPTFTFLKMNKYMIVESNENDYVWRVER